MTLPVWIRFLINSGVTRILEFVGMLCGDGLAVRRAGGGVGLAVDGDLCLRADLLIRGQGDGAGVVGTGSEGAGVGRLVRESCDFLVSIPMYGKVNSLNVSTAASVILCHAARMQKAK